MENFAQLNWLAIGLGTFATFMLGWLWYSPAVFGKKWAQGSGVCLESVNKAPAAAMMTQVLALFCLSLVIGITAQSDALITAVLVILSCTLFAASAGGFSQKSSYAIWVDVSYRTVSGIVMIVLQGIF